MTKTKNIKTYSELIALPTFIERYNYLRLTGIVGEATFGSRRYLNQIFYSTDLWKSTRSKIIIRDNGCDLGIAGREIMGIIMVHHINPITIEDILNNDPKIIDPENLISTSDRTHKAIHYSNESILIQEPIIRREHDTCPWK